MIAVQLFAAWAATQYLAVQRRVRGVEAARGDVPGWVMVTVMTAGFGSGDLCHFQRQNYDGDQRGDRLGRERLQVGRGRLRRVLPSAG